VVLTHLHEPEVLQALQLRFDIDQIYTFCGPILIAVNPFKTIGNMYSQKTLDDYVGGREPKNVPHVWTVAKRSYQAMAKTCRPQAVLISGESGAGKTEATKHVLKFLTEAGSAGRPKPSGSEVSCEQKVLNSNPLLEAFGNACTVRNKNSSRFGKFILLQFQVKAGTSSFDKAGVDVYLLEKVRITEVHANERSYHIFYQACQANQKLKKEDCNNVPLEHFGPVKNFKYLTCSDRQVLDGVDDAKEFQDVVKSMDSLGMPLDQQAGTVEIVAAVLHCGNITFGGTAEEASVVQDASFKKVISLLQVDGAQLEKALCNKLIVTPSEKFESPLPPKIAEERRDALSRIVYGYLFLHLVNHVNHSLGGTDEGAIFIGVLDIFGFEHFEINSFEQLCINFANERLQKIFNDFVFKTEMELYRQEGIPCDAIEYTDNMDIIDLIQGKKASIFAMLDEECKLPKGTDQGLCNKIHKEFAKHPRVGIDKLKMECFIVHHFAGPVTYLCTGFMDKNKDDLGDLLKDVLASSQSEFVVSLLAYGEKVDHSAPAPVGRGGANKKHTVSSEFKGQLVSLVEKIALAGPAFIRCLKPNAVLKPDIINRQSVVEQLRSGGVIEALYVQRAGYPCRAVLTACWKDICILFGGKQRADFQKEKDEVRLPKAHAILQDRLKLPQVKGANTWAVGKTTVFYKQECYELIEAERTSVQFKAATKIRTAWRCIRFHRLFNYIRLNVILIQANYRGYHVRRTLMQEMKDNAAYQEARRKSIAVREADESAKLQAELESETARLAEEERLIEEERRVRESDEAKRRAEEESQRLEVQRRKDEEERQLAEEQRKKLEEAERERRELEEKTRRLEEAESIRKAAVEAEQERQQIEMDSLRQEAEVRTGGLEQQLELLRVSHDESTSRAEAMENEVAGYRANLTALRDQHEATIAELKDAHSGDREATDEALATQRTAHNAQMQEMQSALSEAQSLGDTDARERQKVTEEKFEREVHRMREREAEQKKRHEEELAASRKRQEEATSAWNRQMQDGASSISDFHQDKEMLLRQLEDMKADNDAHSAILENQKDDTKRMYQSQMELTQKKCAETVAALQHEIDMMKQQREQSNSVTMSQLDFQRQEIQASCQQEIELVKRQAENREKSLMGMLDQARQGEVDQQKTKDAALMLKQQQQEERHRCAEAKAKHLEEASLRQQELYESHITHLHKQLKDSAENARIQIENAGQASDRASKVAFEHLEGLEAQLKADQDRVMSAAMDAAKVDTTMLQDQMASLQRENDSVIRKYDETKKCLNRILEKTGRSMEDLEKDDPWVKRVSADSEASKESNGVAPGKRFSRRSTARVSIADLSRRPSVAESARSERSRKQSVRWAMMPEGMAAESQIQMDPGPVGAAARLSRRTLPGLDRKPSLGPRRPSTGSKGSLVDTFGKLGTMNALMGAMRKRAVTDMVQTTLGPGTPNANPADFLQRLLRPSLRQGGRALMGDIGPWRELAADSAVTILRFGEIHKPDQEEVKLAAACRSGTVTIYRIRRTQLERGNSESANGQDQDMAADPTVELRFQSHTKAVTFMIFANNEKELVTTSTDWTARVWNLQDGALIYELVDTSLVICAVPVMRPAGGIIIANTNAVLHFADRESVRQKVRLDNYARTLVLALGGTRLLVGTSRGAISAFSVSEEGLRLMSKLDIGKAGVTCLTIAHCDDGAPPLLAANSMDGTLCLLQANPQLTNFTVLKRVQNPHKLLPLRCCHISSPGGAGFCVTGSEDSAVRCIDLDKFTEFCLTPHTVPVVDIAATGDSMLMASADVRGRIILWRRGCEKAPPQASEKDDMIQLPKATY